MIPASQNIGDVPVTDSIKLHIVNQATKFCLFLGELLERQLRRILWSIAGEIQVTVFMNIFISGNLQLKTCNAAIHLEGNKMFVIIVHAGFAMWIGGVITKIESKCTNLIWI